MRTTLQKSMILRFLATRVSLQNICIVTRVYIKSCKKNILTTCAQHTHNINKTSSQWVGSGSVW